jgi:hypothetical protein
MPDMQNTPLHAAAALAALWQLAGLPRDALHQANLTGDEPVLPSSFALATAAQASLGAASLSAAWLGQVRGAPAQTVSIDRAGAALSCSAHFTLDGSAPPLWDPVSGLYPCGDASGSAGWVRVHANFAHHRDGALRLLGLPAGEGTTRPQVAQALLSQDALAFEQAAADAGLVVAAARTHQVWLDTPQAAWLAEQPVLRWTRLDDTPPHAWPTLRPGQRPLQGLRVLEMTRILAGPVAGRLLAGHGADVLLVNGPHLPNIGAVADTSRGKLSAQLDLRQVEELNTLRGLLADAEVFLQGYRPGALAAFGLDAPSLAALSPGIVVA